MYSFITARLISACIVLLVVSTIVFLMIHLIPGDPVMVMLGESATVADVEQLRVSLGLDLPIWQQWLSYVANLAHGNLGQSLHSGREITSILFERFPMTAVLAIVSLCLSLMLAIPLGILSAVYANRWQDRGIMLIALLGLCIPNFWLGPLLVMFFSLQLGMFPTSGSESLQSIILPSITLGTALAALQSRMIRASLLEVLNENYILAARSRGVGEYQILFRHALSNALIPTVTIIGMQTGALLTGAVVTEQIFDWPGIGQLLIESIEKRDYPLLQATVLLVSTIYVTINLCTDLLYARLDPRIRLESDQ